MSHPQDYSSGLGSAGQSKTLFAIEGEKWAILYLNRGGRESTKRMRFRGPHEALAWCIVNRAGFVWALASQPEHN